MIIYYDRDDPDEASRALALYNDLVETTIKLGYQQYRTSVMCMDRILDSAPEFHRLANTIKAAVDPQNILAPGRYGIGMPDR
jgi:4-cresol dehydrogenase (hydroxylating)